MSTGDVIARIEGHNHYVTSVLFTPDGKNACNGIGGWDNSAVGHATPSILAPTRSRPVSGIEQKAPAGTVLGQAFRGLRSGPER